MVYVALTGITYNGIRIVNDYFEEQNVADYWITGTGFDAWDIKDVKNLKGVTEVQPRIVLEAEDHYDENITLALYGMADFSINTPLIIEGEFPKDNREIMLSYAYGKKLGLQIGDTYEMEIKSTGRLLKKEICALIKSPECMYHVGATALVPDFSRYGFAYMKEEILDEVMGKNMYNQICIKIADGVEDAAIKNAIFKELGNSVVNVLALEDNLNAYDLLEQMNGIKTILLVFPIIFFLVAILIMFSTMTRLIENARMSIGTFKALGYSDGTIMFYYLLYSVLVVLVGFVIGVIPANEIITKPVSEIFFHMIDMPIYQVVPDKSSWVAAFIMTCAFCIGTAYIVTSKALKERPAECMRPKPPKKARKLFFEKIPFLWKILNFSQKYITRNIFRNKARMAICIIGISGCMTLILASFVINDSIDNYLKMISQNQHKYDVLLTFSSRVTRPEYQHFYNMDMVVDIQYEMGTNAKVYSWDKQETTRFTVEDDVIYLKLINAFDPPEFAMPQDGVIMEKSIAEKLGYNVGDWVTIKFTDKNKFYYLQISQIKDGIHGVYASRSYWRSLTKEYVPTSVYIQTADVDALLDKVVDYDFVTSTTTRETIVDSMTNQVSSLSTIVFILIIFGGILALVVLYNLGIMSFYEQIRNLATLMVLGFHDKETKKLLLTENIVFTVIGIVVGTPLGMLLGNMVLASISTFSLELLVQPLSYGISFALTMSFAIIVNIMLGRKMAVIDMLGALKSVE